MFTLCPVGFAAPAVAEKLTLVEDSVRFGGPLRARVTLITLGVPLAPAAAIVTVSVYVPADKPVVETVKPRLDGAVPDAADSVSQGCVLLAVQFSVLEPVLVMFTLCPAGFEAPAVPWNVRLVFETLRVGVAGGLRLLGVERNTPLTTAFDPAVKINWTAT
jgi:hypothetical protein